MAKDPIFFSAIGTLLMGGGIVVNGGPAWLAAVGGALFVSEVAYLLRRHATPKRITK